VGALSAYVALVIKVYVIKGLVWAISSAVLPIPVIPYLAWNNWDSLKFYVLALALFLTFWLLGLFKIIFFK